MASYAQGISATSGAGSRSGSTPVAPGTRPPRGAGDSSRIETGSPTNPATYQVGRGGGTYDNYAAQEAARIAAEKAAAEKKAIEEKAKIEAEKQKKIQEAISYRLKLEEVNKKNEQFMKLTSSAQPEVPTFEIQTTPYIKSDVVDFFRATDTGEKIPIRSFTYVDPTGIGVQKERPATQEEIDLYKTGERALSIESGTASVEKQNIVIKKVGGSISSGLNELNMQLQQVYTKPAGEFIKKKTGLTIEQAKRNAAESTQFLISRGVNPKLAKAGEYTTYYGLATLENIKYKPVRYLSLAAVGAGAGLVIGGVTAGAAAISPTLGSLTNVGVVAGGTYLFTKSLADLNKNIKATQTPYEKAVLSSDFTLASLSFGAGTAGGVKLFKVGRGIYENRGRDYLEVKQGDYPQAPTKAQLDLFKQNTIKELGDLPGGFHTTSSKFWKESITPQAGTSELPGLYISTQVSRPFARIFSSKTSSLPILQRIQLTWRSILLPSTSPAIAYIVPKGFRASPFAKVKPYKIGEQSFSRAWKLQAKKGFADVPGIKTEIEAILRTDAGSYQFQSGKYYTTIKGVRVPIDVFNYAEGEIISVPSTQVSKLLGSGSGSYSISSLTSTSFYPLSFQSEQNKTSSNYKSVSNQLSNVSSVIQPTKRYGSSSARSSRSSVSSTVSPSSLSKALSSSTTSYKKSSQVPYRLSRSLGMKSSRVYRMSKVSTKKALGGFKRKPSEDKLRTGRFTVSLRRFGKFRQIGTTSDLNKAFAVGTEKARTTLGRTFKVEGINKALKTPKGFYSKISKKGETLYIQKAKFALGTSGEKFEIQSARRKRR